MIQPLRPLAMLLSAGLLVGGLSLGAALPAQAATHDNRTGGGLLVPQQKIAPKTKMKSYSRLALGASVLPVSADLTQYAVPSKDQGDTNSCVSWAIAYTMMGWYANKAGTPETFAPMYVYSQTHLSDQPGDGGGGSYAEDAYNITYTQGVDTAAHYAPGDYNYKTKPTAAEMANAANYKTSPMTPLFSDSNPGGSAGITSIKQALAAGTPVGIGMFIYDGFDNLNSSDYTWHEADNGAAEGGHYVVALGYNSTGLLIENSWGPTWGNRGYAILGWDYVANEVFEAETITGFQNTLPAPTYTAPSSPKNFKVFANSSKSTTLSWQSPNNTGNKSLAGYTLAYTGGGSTRTRQLTAGTQRVSVTGLKPYTQYSFTLTANNEIGSSTAAKLSLRTLAGAPVARSFKAKIASRSIRLTWQAAQANAAGIKNYKVIVAKGKSAKTYTLAQNRRSFTVTKLRPHSSYRIIFVVTNTSGKTYGIDAYLHTR